MDDLRGRPTSLTLQGQGQHLHSNKSGFSLQTPELFSDHYMQRALPGIPHSASAQVSFERNHFTKELLKIVCVIFFLNVPERYLNTMHHLNLYSYESQEFPLILLNLKIS